jgi:hypothetical protein
VQEGRNAMDRIVRAVSVFISREFAEKIEAITGPVGKSVDSCHPQTKQVLMKTGK